MSTDKLQMGLFMCLLEQGDIFGPAQFESITAYCVTSGVLGGPNYVQMINMLLLCSSGLILIPILQRTPDGGRVIVILYFIRFPKNCTNSCYILTKLRADGLVSSLAALRSCLSCPLTGLWSCPWWWRVWIFG